MFWKLFSILINRMMDSARIPSIDNTATNRNVHSNHEKRFQFRTWVQVQSIVIQLDEDTCTLTRVLHTYKVRSCVACCCWYAYIMVIPLLNFEFAFTLTIYRHFAVSGILRYLLLKAPSAVQALIRALHWVTLQNQNARWAHFSKNRLLRELRSMCASR